MKSMYVGIISVVLLGLMLTGAFHAGRLAERGKWQIASGDMKQEASQQLTVATQRTNTADEAATNAGHRAEINNANGLLEVEHQRHVSDAAVATAHGVLHDPGHRPSCSSSVPKPSTDSGVSENTAPGAGLSAEATEFLLEFAERCDKAANYASAAHGWAMSLPAQLPETAPNG